MQLDRRDPRPVSHDRLTPDLDLDQTVEIALATVRSGT
jgi:hypothetical protein